jgi:hypothetical protein
MCDRTAHERHLSHAGETKIGDILPASAQEAIVLFAKR